MIRRSIRHLMPGILLILLASAALLLGDLGSRRSSRMIMGMEPERIFRIALVQHGSTPALDKGAEGVLQELAERGYDDGARAAIRRFNAQGDSATATAIAKQVTSGVYDLIVTISTPSLQTVAAANHNGTPHVFGLVTDPFAAGVGIDPADPSIHPPYMTGSGCLQPVDDSFKIARALYPELRSVGLVWNPSESNSLAQTMLARQVCGDLGIDLLESPVDSTPNALEAASALCARGVQAIWMSGDITVAPASQGIIGIARRAGIPVFTSQPLDVKSGALFDLGADYVEVGRVTGGIAADVLSGTSPASIPVKNIVPKLFLYNETALVGLRDPWRIPASIRAKANGWITADETKLPDGRLKPPMPTPAPHRTYRLGIAYFAPEEQVDLCMKGLFDGLRAEGLEEGKNLTVRRIHAQGEISNIPAMIQTLASSDVDLIVAMSTPVISVACSTVRNKPVVLTYCSDPIAAGAGKSFMDHLPNVTGIGSFPPVMGMVELIRAMMPQAKTIGTIYNAAEANSVKVIGVARELFPQAGLKLEEVTVASSADVLQAAQALASRGVDAIYVQGDNTVSQAYPAVVKAASDARIPLFTDDPTGLQGGAVACSGTGFYEPGHEAAGMVARILYGTSPSELPIRNVGEKIEWVDRPLATSYGLVIPASLPDEPATSPTP